MSSLEEKGTKGNAALGVLKSVLPADFQGDVAKYNDTPGRTQAHVLALFDRAIRKLNGTKKIDYNALFTVETRKTRQRKAMKT